MEGVGLVYTLSLCMRFHCSGIGLVSKGGLIRGGISKRTVLGLGAYEVRFRGMGTRGRERTVGGVSG